MPKRSLRISTRSFDSSSEESDASAEQEWSDTEDSLFFDASVFFGRPRFRRTGMSSAASFGCGGEPGPFGAINLTFLASTSSIVSLRGLTK